MTGKLQRYRDLLRRRASEGHSSALRQVFEIGYLYLRNRVRPSDYYASGLYRSTIPWSAKKDYLWGTPYLKWHRHFSDISCTFVILNKVVTYGLLRSFGIPIPAFYGLLHRADGQTFDGRPLQSVEDLDELIRRTQLDELCFKPVGGWGGKGFLKVRFRREGQVTAALQDEGTFTALADFWTVRLHATGGPAYVCQGVVEQHPEVAQIHPESINTARIWMFQSKRGEWRMYDAVLRMGVGSMLVDNTSSGGITSRIDIRTGVCGQAIDMTPERVTSDVHPTTHAQVAGRVLPMWDDVGRLCMRTCRAFPYFRLLGIDVAFGKEAPLILEVESSPDPVHQIAFDHGVGGLLRELAAAGRFDWRS